MTFTALGYIPLLITAVVAQAIPLPVDLLALAMVKVHFPLIPVLVLTIAGLTVGAILDYLFGRYGIELIPWFRKEKKHRNYKRAEKFYKKYGQWSLLFGFFPVIGVYFPVVAGALEEPILTFLVIYLSGKLIYYLAIFGTLYYFRLI